MEKILITGHTLTLEELAAVCRDNAPVALAPEAKQRILESRQVVDMLVDEAAVVYGVTAGFGKFSDVIITQDECRQLQRNLIVTHAVGAGRPLPPRTWPGASCCCGSTTWPRAFPAPAWRLVETLVAMLNRGVHPVIPQKGSLGASGDLAPLSHMVLVMLGEGEAWYQGESNARRRSHEKGRHPGGGTGRQGGPGPDQRHPGHDSHRLLCASTTPSSSMKTADICRRPHRRSATWASRTAYDPQSPRRARPPGPDRLRRPICCRLLEGSGLAADVQPGKVQDAYSLRCVPQVHGASRDSHQLRMPMMWISREINAVTDNPLIFPDEDDVISGGNFHGEPVALAMDFIGHRHVRAGRHLRAPHRAPGQSPAVRPARLPDRATAASTPA